MIDIEKIGLCVILIFSGFMLLGAVLSSLDLAYILVFLYGLFGVMIGVLITLTGVVLKNE